MLLVIVMLLSCKEMLSASCTVMTRPFPLRNIKRRRGCTTRLYNEAGGGIAQVREGEEVRK